MKIKYLAHATFLIISNTGTRIIIDPYASGEGLEYGDIAESADVVTVSHGHFDHNNVSAVGGNPEVVKGASPLKVKGIAFKGISVYHDDAGGKQRGENIIFCLEVDGIKICHLGDLGHQLDDKQVAELGKVDILLVPVGGYYTIDAKVASQVCDVLKPKVVIPMHYKTAKCDYPLSGVDEFLHGKKDVSQLSTSEVEFALEGLPANTQIIVLKPSR